MGPKATGIYFSDPKQKVKSGFGLYSNDFLDGPLPNILLAIILIGLGKNE